MRAAHGAGIILNKISKASVKSLQFYILVAPCLQTELQQLHPPALNPDNMYGIPWLLRAKFCSNLGKMQKLPAKPGLRISDLHGVFPDAVQWLGHFEKNLPEISTIRRLTNLLDFKHGVHLLTMFFCLVGDRYVQTFAPKYINKHHDSLREHLEKYIREHAVVPHPAVLLQEHGQSTSMHPIH